MRDFRQFSQLETYEKERVWSFPHRHGEATGKPETRDETRGSSKTNISCETSANFHRWRPTKRRGFAASPIDTAKPQENQRLETRHVGAAKRAFHARRPPILTLCSLKIDVFLRVFLGTSKFATSKSMFRARLPSIFSTSHKMPRLPRNLHLLATWRRPANAIRKKHATRHVWSAAPATQNDDGHVQSAAPATKTATHFAKTSQKYSACNTKPLSTRYKTRLNVTKCHACHAKRSNETFETSKKDPFCRTYHSHGHRALTRTVADGCERKRNVERTHPQPPDPQSETGTLATHSGKKCISFNKKTGDEPRDLGCIYSIFRHTILESSSLNSLIFIACGSIEALATGNHLFVHWRRLLPIEIAPWELNRWHARPASLGDKRLVVDHRLLHWVTPVVALNWLTWMCIPGPYMFVNQLSIYIYIYMHVCIHSNQLYIHSICPFFLVLWALSTNLYTNYMPIQWEDKSAKA